MPVLVGFDPGVTLTCRVELSPGCTLAGFADPIPPNTAQLLVGDDVLRGFGVPLLKSSELSSVSVHPSLALKTAVVLLGAGVGPEPSKQLAVPPKPTKSMMDGSDGQASVRALVVLTNATLPAVALIAMVPVTSGTRLTVPPAPAAS